MIELNNKIGGRYFFKKRKANGTIEPVAHVNAKNLVTDGWLNRLNNGFSTSFSSNGDLRFALAECAVGTGSTAPDGTETALESEVARTGSGFGNPQHISHVFTPAGDNTAITGVHTLRYTFGIGAVVGNISEVGVYHGGFGGSGLASRALVRDDLGDPTTITVLADEQLIVDYELTITLATNYETAVVFRQGEPDEYSGTMRIRASGRWPTSRTGQSTDPMWVHSASVHWDALSSSRMLAVPITDEIQYPPSANPTAPATFITNFDPTNVTGTPGSTTRVAITTNILPNTPMGVFHPVSSTTAINTEVMSWPIQFNPLLTKKETEQLTIDVITTWSRS